MCQTFSSPAVLEDLHACRHTPLSHLMTAAVFFDLWPHQTPPHYLNCVSTGSAEILFSSIAFITHTSMRSSTPDTSILSA